MSYPAYTTNYNSGYPPQGGPPMEGHGYSQPGYPQQPSYGGFPAPGAPGFQGPPAGYSAQYAPQYNSSYGAPPPQGHSPYANAYPTPGYGAPPSHEQHSYPDTHSHSRSHSPASYPQASHNGHGASPQPHMTSSIPSAPVQFRFAQKNGFDGSGSIKDKEGRTIYKLKDEADKHSIFGNFKSRPLAITRGDGTKVAVFQWKGSPQDAKLECYAVWGSPGQKSKLKVEGDILDKDWKFKLPDGRAYEWDGPTPTGQWDLLDHQQMQGEGLDMRGKSVARYTPHTENDDATIDVVPEVFAVPSLLDAAIMTSFQIEWTRDYNEKWQ